MKKEDLAELTLTVEQATQKRDLVLLLTTDRDQSRCSVRLLNAEEMSIREYLNCATLVLWRLLGVAEQTFPDCRIDVPSVALAMGNIIADATEHHKVTVLDGHATYPVRPSGFALFVNAKEIGALQHLFEKIGEDGSVTPRAIAALRSPIRQVANIARKMREDFSKLQTDKRSQGSGAPL